MRSTAIPIGNTKDAEQDAMLRDLQRKGEDVCHQIFPADR